jgi:protocatechuate 3,4-dioxygenase beta subunit
LAGVAVLALWFVVGRGPRSGERTTPRRQQGAAAERDIDPARSVLPAASGSSIRGVVVDRRSTPVAHAAIAALSFPWRGASELDGGRAEATLRGQTVRSDRRGAFLIPMDRQQPVTLEIRPPAPYAPLEIPEVSPGEFVRVVLDEAVALTVRVRDERGAPLKDALVHVYHVDRAAPRSLHRWARTWADGSCEFRDLPSSLVVLVAATHRDSVSVNGVECELEAPTNLVTVDLPAGGTITGTVTDAVTGVPIANARVGMGWTLEAPTLTDGDGRFVLRGWTGDGFNSLHVLAAGYGRAQALVGDASYLEIECERGCDIIGRVISGQGGALASARVAAMGRLKVGRQRYISAATAVADADGRFRLRDLRSDLPHVVVALADGYGRTCTDLNEADPDQTVIDCGDIVLPQARAIGGHVVMVDGQPVPRRRVMLAGANDDRSRLAPQQVRSYGAYEEVYTDDRGRFHFEGLAPGAYEVSVSRRGQLPASVPVQLTARADIDNVAVVLDAVQRFLVRVAARDGSPQAEALVVAQTERGAVRGTTDSHGTATLACESDVLGLQITPTRGALLPKRVAVDASAVIEGGCTVVLDEAAVIRGRVETAGGAACVGATLQATRDGACLGTATTDDGGHFTLKIPTDTAEVELAASARIEGKEMVGCVDRVGAGATGIVVDVTPVQHAGSVKIHARTGDERPVPGVRVTVYGSWGERVADAMTDNSGVVRFDGLPERALVAAGGPDKNDMVGGRVMFFPRGQSLVLRYATALSIVGTVTAHGHVPYEDVVIVGEGPAGQAMDTSMCDARGTFRLLVSGDMPVVRVQARYREGAKRMESEWQRVTAPATRITLELRDP